MLNIKQIQLLYNKTTTPILQTLIHLYVSKTLLTLSLLAKHNHLQCAHKMSNVTLLDITESGYKSFIIRGPLN